MKRKKSCWERTLNWMNTPSLALLTLAAFVWLADTAVKEQERKELESHGITEESASRYSSEPDAEPSEAVDQLADAGILSTDHGSCPLTDDPLFNELMRVESGLNPEAVSKTGAYGCSQLTVQTARHLGVDRYDMKQNIEGGLRYLNENRKRFHSDYMAVLAYSMGPTALEKWVKAGANPAHIPAETKYHSLKVFTAYESKGYRAKLAAKSAEFKVAQR